MVKGNFNTRAVHNGGFALHKVYWRGGHIATIRSPKKGEAPGWYLYDCTTPQSLREPMYMGEANLRAVKETVITMFILQGYAK